MMADFFNPEKRFNREFGKNGNWANLFSGDIAKIRPFGLGNEPGTPESRAGKPLTTSAPVTPAADAAGDDLRKRQRAVVGAGTKTLLG